MTLTYCVVYLSLIDDSPSLFTVMSIYNTGNKGLSKMELSYLITDEIYSEMIYPEAGSDFYSPSVYDKCRDNVIIIGTGFGRLKEGAQVHQVFTPINQAGGERRLNVITTRARDSLHLVTSLLSSDITLFSYLGITTSSLIDFCAPCCIVEL